jgi:hypothetical protein
MTHVAAMLDRAPTPDALVSVFGLLSEGIRSIHTWLARRLA